MAIAAMLPIIDRVPSADQSRAAAIVVGAIEYAWRFGAFVCLLVTVDRTPALPAVEGRLALDGVFLLFCFVPRLDVSAVALGLIGAFYLIERTVPGSSASFPPALAKALVLVWLAIGLVACAGVLHAFSSRPKRVSSIATAASCFSVLPEPFRSS
jgi:hypothetical protein